MPNLKRLHNINKYFLACRPSFLSITIIAYSVGFSIQPSTQHIGINIFALLVSVLGHAAGNLINDYHDHINGTDAINTNRIPPFTGGSRFIQNGILQANEIKKLSQYLLLTTITCGILIGYLSDIKIIFIGCLAVFLGWAYSAPPLKLMSRGILGILTITATWTLIPIGSAMLNLHELWNSNLLTKTFLISLSFGLMTSNILFINQIPDTEADLSCGKLTFAGLLSTTNLKWAYLSICISAFLVLSMGYLFKIISPIFLDTLSVLPIFLFGFNYINSYKRKKLELRKAIILTIIGVHIFGILLITNNLINLSS